MTPFALPSAASAPWHGEEQHWPKCRVGACCMGCKVELASACCGSRAAFLSLSCSFPTLCSEGWTGSKRFLGSLGAKKGQEGVLNHDCLSLLQSKTPALVFEYINNTDFKVSLPERGRGRLPISVECCDCGCQILLESCGGSLGLSLMSASPSFSPVNQKSVNGL